MNPLPNYEEAVIEDSKFVSYALNPQSDRGQHKARVFESALGFNLSNWERLKQAILDALPFWPATLTSETTFGKKYEIVVPITGANGRTVDVITVWQFDRLPDGVNYANAPRLVTLYIP
ncbi:MAG: DUF6883 domain-containing protein [Candidatus Entotheonellia bacterium]